MGGGCHRVRLADGDALVRRHHLRDAHAAIGPLHRHRIDGIAPPDAEGQQVVHARLEAARGLFLLEELLLPAPQRHRRADREPVGALSLELDLEIVVREQRPGVVAIEDRKSTRLNSSHSQISYAVFCLKKKKKPRRPPLLRAFSAQRTLRHTQLSPSRYFRPHAPISQRATDNIYTPPPFSTVHRELVTILYRERIRNNEHNRVNYICCCNH